MAKSKESILYKLEKDNTVSGYLLGTMHVRDKRAFGYLDKIEQLIVDCEIFYAETDIADMQALSTEGILNFKNGDHIRHHLSPKKFKKLNKISKKAFNTDLDTVGHLMPLTILNYITLQILSDDMNLPLDHHLWNFASNQKICRGLETAEEQRSIFLNIPLDWQLKQFKDALRDVGSFRKGIVKMADYYHQGKINKLYKGGKKQLGAMRGLMLYNRNAIMAERAAEALEANTCFISVGAAHLPGKKGMLRLLKKKGYKLSPIYT